MNDNIRHEIAHLARVELLSPDPEGTVWFLTQLLGMYITKQEGQSVYLRGYEDPYQWSIKVTESAQAGMQHAALRTSSPEALERRVASLTGSGIEGTWAEDEFGYGKTYSFHGSDGHRFSLVWEVEKYQATPELKSKILTRASKRPLQGIPVKRLDHLNLMSSDVRATRQTLQQNLGYRRTEAVVHEGGEMAAWLSTNLLGHEIAVVADQSGAKGRLHHVALYYGTQQALIDAAEMLRDYDVKIEVGPDVHGVTQGAFLYAIEPGGNRIEMFGNTGFLHFDPDEDERIWSIPEFNSGGMAIGGAELPPAFFAYGTPDLSPEAVADLRDLSATSR